MDDVAAHVMTRRLVEEVKIPGHVDRTESEKFRRNKQFLVHERDLPCWRCGSKDRREVHHLIEWSFAKKINWDRARRVLAAFAFYSWTQDEAAKVEDPDDLGNLLVLCADCHRGVDEEPGSDVHTGFGIHTLTFPAWLGEAAVQDGEEITPDDHVVA